MSKASSLSSSSPSAAAAASGTKRPPPPCSPPVILLRPPPVPQGWTRCHAYLERKHRFCRQQCQGKQWNQTAAAAAVADDNDDNSTGPRYCGNHQHLFFSNDCTTKPTSSGEENSTQPSSQPDNNSNISNEDNCSKMMNKRIPCPIDPTHHIPADKLEKHILVCPKIKRLQAMEKLYYYRHNLNTGGHGRMEHDSSSSSFTSSTTPTTSDATGGIQTQSLERGGIKWAKRVALCVLKVHEQVFSHKHHHYHQQNPDNSSETCSPTASTKKDDHLYCMSYEEIVNALPLQDLSSSSFSSLSQDQPQQQQQQQDEKSNLARAIQAYNIKSGGPKHVHQQASLLGHLRQLGAIPCTSPSSSMVTFQPPQQQQQQQQTQQQQQRKRKRIINILELGAGRGMMGLVAAGVAAAAAAATRTVGNEDNATTTPSTMTTTTTRLILVERSGCRSKADRILRNHKNHAGPFNKTLTNNKEDNTVTACTSTKDASSDRTTTVQEIASSSTSTTTTNSTTTTSSVPLPSPVIDYMNLQDLEWARMTCDLAHVDMNEVLNHSWSGGGDSDPSSTIQQEEQEQEQEIHIVAKHLCGVGTDLALKSLQPIRHSISTCLFATCCHGACSWKDYVGRDYLRSVMICNNNNNNIKSNNANNTSNNMTIYLSQFGEAEFELLCQWSAGTVATNWSSGGVGGGGKKSPQSNQDVTGREQRTRGNDNDNDDDDNEHKTAGSNNNSNSHAAAAIGVSTIVEALDLKCGVQGLGRACQRLIDYGRLEYMRNVLFGNDSSSAATTANSTQSSNEEQDIAVKLVYYVSADITPQNAALMGRRQ